MSQIIDIIRCVVQQEMARIRTSLLGVITAIYAHEAKDDDYNCEANVRLKHENLELKRVPIAIDHMGAIALPVVGDLVLVQFIDGDLNQPVITGRFYHEENRPPLHKAGDIMLEQRYGDPKKPTLNQLRFGADGAIYLQQQLLKPEDNSMARASIQIDKEGAITVRQDKVQDDSSEPRATIQIDKDANISISYSGEKKAAIQIDKDGNITLSADKKLKISLTNDSKLEIIADSLPIDITCSKMTVTGKLTVTDDTTLQGKLDVSKDSTIQGKLVVGSGMKTTIDGNTITGG